MTNEEVLERIGEKTLLNVILHRKINWIGRIPHGKSAAFIQKRTAYPESLSNFKSNLV